MNTQTKSGTLFLIPTNLGQPIQPEAILPAQVIALTARLEYFVVENAKTARQFLKSLNTVVPLQSLNLRELNEHTPASDLRSLLQPALEGKDVGLLSDAGAPAVADPGAQLVALAHASGVAVAPLVGPSSLLLALMASGLNGQTFAFHGYLPIERPERIAALAALERESGKRNMTQIFIETPYRNNALLDDIVANTSAETKLCLATNLTAVDQFICTKRVAQWRTALPDLNRKPTVFLLLSEAAASDSGRNHFGFSKKGILPQERQ